MELGMSLVKKMASGLSLLILLLGPCMPASAQSLLSEESIPVQEKVAKAPEVKKAIVDDEESVDEISDEAGVSGPVLDFGDEAAARPTAPKDGEEEPYVPITERPTADGVARGHVSLVRTDENGKEVDPASQTAQIFLFYTNFKMERSMVGSQACSMRFVVTTNLDRKLVNLSVRLVWPEMTTNLAYINVNPNTPTFFDYTLLGEGCYSMDKIPNIVVNRCRVRGLSSSECASKITWLKAAK